MAAVVLMTVVGVTAQAEPGVACWNPIPIVDSVTSVRCPALPFVRKLSSAWFAGSPLIVVIGKKASLDQSASAEVAQDLQRLVVTYRQSHHVTFGVLLRDRATAEDGSSRVAEVQESFPAADFVGRASVDPSSAAVVAGDPLILVHDSAGRLRMAATASEIDLAAAFAIIRESSVAATELRGVLEKSLGVAHPQGSCLVHISGSRVAARKIEPRVRAIVDRYTQRGLVSRVISRTGLATEDIAILQTLTDRYRISADESWTFVSGARPGSSLALRWGAHADHDHVAAFLQRNTSWWRVELELERVHTGEYARTSCGVTAGVPSATGSGMKRKANTFRATPRLIWCGTMSKRS